MFVANIKLVDGTHLRECLIFNDDTKGIPALNFNKQEIEDKLKKFPWGNELRTVFFQTHHMNGYIPVMSLKENCS